MNFRQLLFDLLYVIVIVGIAAAIVSLIPTEI